MDTYQIDQFLKSDKFAKKGFKGVIPINYLPLKYVDRPSSYIINTDNSNLPGEHWFALYIPLKGPIEYWDSYGLKPINNEIYKFIKMNKRPFIYNRFKIQSNNSMTCGQYSIFYIYLRSRNIKMKKITNFFIKNRSINDKIIMKIFKKIN
jgi:hypothetical protein